MASCAKTKANLKRPPLPVAKGPSNLAVVLDASPCLARNADFAPSRWAFATRLLRALAASCDRTDASCVAVCAVPASCRTPAPIVTPHDTRARKAEEAVLQRACNGEVPCTSTSSEDPPDVEATCRRALLMLDSATGKSSRLKRTLVVVTADDSPMNAVQLPSTFGRWLAERSVGLVVVQLGEHDAQAGGSLRETVRELARIEGVLGGGETPAVPVARAGVPAHFVPVHATHAWRAEASATICALAHDNDVNAYVQALKHARSTGAEGPLVEMPPARSSSSATTTPIAKLPTPMARDFDLFNLGNCRTETRFGMVAAHALQAASARSRIRRLQDGDASAAASSSASPRRVAVSSSSSSAAQSHNQQQQKLQHRQQDKQQKVQLILVARAGRVALSPALADDAGFGPSGSPICGGSTLVHSAGLGGGCAGASAAVSDARQGWLTLERQGPHACRLRWRPASSTRLEVDEAVESFAVPSVEGLANGQHGAVAITLRRPFGRLVRNIFWLQEDWVPSNGRCQPPSGTRPACSHADSSTCADVSLPPAAAALADHLRWAARSPGRFGCVEFPTEKKRESKGGGKSMVPSTPSLPWGIGDGGMTSMPVSPFPRRVATTAARVVVEAARAVEAAAAAAAGGGPALNGSGAGPAKEDDDLYELD